MMAGEWWTKIPGTEALARLSYCADQRSVSEETFWDRVDAALLEDSISDADVAAASKLSAATVARRKAQLRKEGKL